MTTRSNDIARNFELGTINEIPMIAADIIYEGSAIGLVVGTGHARPLTLVDIFAGFAESQCDNLVGGAAAKNVRMRKSGLVQLPVSGAVITDVSQPVYATDDDTFVFLPTGGVFIGFVHRYVSSGVVIVAFDVDNFVDPYAGKVAATVSANTTLNGTHSGKALFVDTDAKIITLPAVEGIGGIQIVNIGAFGAVAVKVTPATGDMIEGPGITGSDNKYIINTKETARRGDYIDIEYGDANGWTITRIKGTWARET